MIGCVFAEKNKDLVHIPKRALVDEELTREDLQFLGAASIECGVNNTWLHSIPGFEEANIELLEERGYIYTSCEESDGYRKRVWANFLDV